MPKISVIVPVYNVEKYLRRCVDSILNQTFSDFELILVDDGSPDNSGMICDEYAKKDNRIKVIHKQNAGVSTARNTGIDKAVGEYLMFVDSDDFIDNAMFEKMVNRIGNKPDMVIASIKMVCNKGEYEYRMGNDIYTSKELIEEFCFDKFPRICVCGPCCKLYRLDKIKDNNIRFDELLNLGEDTYFNMQYVLKCTQIISISDICYYYMRDNEKSLFTKFRSYYYENGKQVFQKVLKTAEDLNCAEESVDKYIKDYACGLIYNVGKAIMTSDKNVCIEYMEKLSVDDVLKNNMSMLKNNYRNYLLAKMILNRHYLLVYYASKLRYDLKNKITKIKNGEL